MIIHTLTRELRVRSMYPGEGERPGHPAGDACGYYFLDYPCEIAIDATMAPAEQATILIHEIIHSIYHERKMPTRAAEETVCHHLGIALAEIIRDNPDLLAAIGLALTDGVPIVGALTQGEKA